MSNCPIVHCPMDRISDDQTEWTSGTIVVYDGGVESLESTPLTHHRLYQVKKGCWKDQKVDIKLRNLDLFLEDFGTLTELGRSLGSSWFTLTKMLDNDKKKETPTFRPDKRPPPGPPRKKIGRINPGGQNGPASPPMAGGGGG
ncbi:hypothetical protein TrispH2_008444 [Trichoplax sp. H2]|nr:hypothetical protein TrispH2_008444 [Trichoplax sp. H2]|eukprot:RDD39409.1 hypothetical protein TrispH2_008444 [Trichoplax sp. H2]